MILEREMILKTDNFRVKSTCSATLSFVAKKSTFYVPCKYYFGVKVFLSIISPKILSKLYCNWGT